LRKLLGVVDDPYQIDPELPQRDGRGATRSRRHYKKY
jgi:hypothetical protein